ncbi:MAG: DNA repair protein RecO [Ignavibacteria bacterium]|nr:DNA repair protein RecO [Ignavibacteria bacterium]
MSQIRTTEGIVLSVSKYSDSSKIASIYTKDFGKISIIAKGARQKSSKAGNVIDPINHVQAVFYEKESREIQTLSSADLIEHYTGIREDFDRLKYALAITELTANLTQEHEIHQRLYAGLVRIFQRLNQAVELPQLTFLRFYVFLLGEIGYSIDVENCSLCGNQIYESDIVGFAYDKGCICEDCLQKTYSGSEFPVELFRFLYCLKKGIEINLVSDSLISSLTRLLERFTEYHLPAFRPLNALRM